MKTEDVVYCMVKIGTRLKDYLEEVGMSQAELARKSCLTPACISQIVNHQRRPSTEAIFRICESLDISSDWLLGLIEGD